MVLQRITNLIALNAENVSGKPVSSDWNLIKEFYLLLILRLNVVRCVSYMLLVLRNVKPSGVPPFPHILPFCRAKKHLLHHLQTHTNERKFECPTCKKCFKTIGNLKQHKHSHGPPKYKCEVCGQKFSFHTGLLNHVRAIHGLKKPAPKELLSEESMDVPFSEESME